MVQCDDELALQPAVSFEIKASCMLKCSMLLSQVKDNGLNFEDRFYELLSQVKGIKYWSSKEVPLPSCEMPPSHGLGVIDADILKGREDRSGQPSRGQRSNDPICCHKCMYNTHI